MRLRSLAGRGALCLGVFGSGALVRAADPLTPVTIENFEGAKTRAKVWVVNIPNENASVQLSKDQASDGKQSLKLHYKFTGGGQYLGVPLPVMVDAPIHKLSFMVFGDGSGAGCGVYIADASGETHKFKAKGSIDFKGWKQVSVDLDGGHETWGGDKNGKMNYPLKEVTVEIGTPGKAIESDLYFDAFVVASEQSAAATLSAYIGVTEPAYYADIQGNTTISLEAPGVKNIVATCWKQGKGFGTDTIVAKVSLDESGKGSFVFPADDFPHGPVVVTISSSKGAKKDNCYLMLYNKGGVSWNEGLPKEVPPGAKDLKLVFADDFDGPLSISSTDTKATYYDHKPPHGTQDFSSIPFTSHSAPNTPFAQRDSYLRIRASEPKKSAGIISSLKNDGSGVKVTAPCYFECRFVGQSAPGSWPAFWLLTDNIKDTSKPCDELDIIEAYGGEGYGSPNAPGLYQITPHAWNQGKAGSDLSDAAYKTLKNPCDMKKFGIPSQWHNTLHTFGILVTDKDTVYYCDNIEVGRHETLPVSKTQPHFFLINMGTGGGWPVDLSRYGGQADMYVDFVRVYAAKN